MSGPAGSGTGRAGMGGLVVPALGLLVFAAAVPAAFAHASGAAGDELLALLGAGVAAAGVQVVLLSGFASHARRKLVAADGQGVARLSGTVRSFPLILAVGAGLIGAAVFPAAALGAALGMDLEARALLAGHWPVWGITQAVFLLSLHRVARGWISRQLARAAVFAESGLGRRRSATPLLVWLLVLPAVGVSLGLGWKAEQLLRAETLGGSTEVYRRLTEAVLTAPPLPVGAGTAGVVEALTRFDEASPFVYSPTSGWKGAIDAAGLQILEQALDESRRGVAVDGITGVGLVWSTLSDGVTVIGVRLTRGPDPRSPYIVVSLVLAAAFSAALIALLLGGRVRVVLARLAAALDTVPDGEPPPALRSSNREVRRLFTEIEGIRPAVLERRASQREMIEQHGEAREKQARVFTGMSHDLRSPLNSVIGFTDLLLKGMDGELTPGQRGAVSRIAQEAERLLVLIGDILDTAKIEAGRFELERVWVPSVELLTECELGAQRLVASKDVEFLSELQPGLPPVLVDKERVLQALLSLICRAVDSMESGTVRLKAWRHSAGPGAGSELRVDIIDSGGALPEAIRQRLVGVLSATDDEEPSGEFAAIGLGISLARRIMGLHGGEVTMASHESGSVFTVTVPLDESPDGA